MTLAFREFSPSKIDFQDIQELQSDIRDNSDKIRRGEISGSLLEKEMRDLADRAFLLTDSNAPNLMKVTTLAEAAANTGSTALRALTIEQLAEAYPTNIDEPVIRELNEQTTQEYLTAIEHTDKNTPFNIALHEAELIVDEMKGRDFEQDVIVPTEEKAKEQRELDELEAKNAKIKEEMRKSREERLARATAEDLSEEDDAASADMSAFFDDQEDEDAAA